MTQNVSFYWNPANIKKKQTKKNKPTTKINKKQNKNSAPITLDGGNQSRGCPGGSWYPFFCLFCFFSLGKKKINPKQKNNPKGGLD